MDMLTAQAGVTGGQVERAMQLLQQRTGIIVGEHKMKSSQRLLFGLCKQYGFSSIDAFLNEIANNDKHPVWESLINAFTINHTAFFREPHHFEMLAQYLEKHRTNCEMWCAAASTGQEPYSMAMVLNEVLGEHTVCPVITATDIDSNALKRARAGVYNLGELNGVSPERLKRHFLRGVNSFEGKARVKPALASRVEFSELNLISPSWPHKNLFDVIFCRNTMIYFDRDTQIRLIAGFARVMKPGGLLFIGHSETLASLTDKFTLLGQTVYQRNSS